MADILRVEQSPAGIEFHHLQDEDLARELGVELFLTFCLKEGGSS